MLVVSNVLPLSFCVLITDLVDLLTSFFFEHLLEGTSLAVRTEASEGHVLLPKLNEFNDPDQLYDDRRRPARDI